MIRVDTSAWVEFLRAPAATSAAEWRELLHAVCDPVRMEVLAGARDGRHLRDLRRLLVRCTSISTMPTDDEGAA